MDDPLKTVPPVALFGGSPSTTPGHVGFRLRNVGTLNRPRLLALWSASPDTGGTEVDAIVALALAAAVNSAVIAYETIRYAEARRRVRRAET